MQDRNVYILHSEDVCLDFILHNVDLQLLLFSVYIPDCICVENNPVNVLSSVNVVKMILSGAENFFENESNLQSFKGSHSLLSIFCCNFSWKKLSKSPGISWNFDFEFVWQPCLIQLLLLFIFVQFLTFGGPLLFCTC